VHEDNFQTPEKVKFTPANLCKFDEYLEKNKFKEQDFPEGAELLTYLFRILLCVESDL